MNKQYAGHAKRVMFGIWSFLRQFMYTKMIIVTDDDVNIRDWKDVVWALTTRVDPARDTLIVRAPPIDYLDFASPVAGLGSKIGIDATNKWPGETTRQWGRPITMDPAVTARVEAIWDSLRRWAPPKPQQSPALRSSGGRRPRRCPPRCGRARRPAAALRLRSAAVHQHSDQEACNGRRADRRPWVVVHVIVGDARRGPRMIHRFAFELLQPQFRREQLRFHLRAQILRALAGLIAGALQQSSASLSIVEKSSSSVSRDRFIVDSFVEDVRWNGMRAPVAYRRLRL